MVSNFIPPLSLLSGLLIFTFSFQTCVKSRPLLSGSFDKGASLLTEIYDIVDLHLSLWGNVRLLSNKTIECQHGEKECFLNTIAACAIHVWPDVLELKYAEAEETSALKPPLHYTPWLVVGGKPVYEVVFRLFLVAKAEASIFRQDKKETSEWKKADKLILVTVIVLGIIWGLYLFIYGAYKLYMRFKKIRIHHVDSQEDEN